MKQIRIGIALITLLAATSFSRAETAPEIVLFTWNVENLFDWEDDPANPGDDEFTPKSWQEWTESRYRQKLTNLAEVIAMSKADFVGMQEIENRRVLEDLTQVLREVHGRDYPYIIHREGPDHRGIDVALISAYPAVATNWFTPVEEQRDVLQATFEPHGSPLTLFVNHNKSRWGGKEQTDPQRLQQTTAVREAVESLLSAKPESAIVVMGDFNDNFDDASLVNGLRSVSSRERFIADPGSGPFLNLHAGLPEPDRHSFYYFKGKVWNSLDSMHVTRGMLIDTPAPQWKALPETYAVFRDDKQMDAGGHPKAFRRITDPETKKRFFQYGYSDHFPVRLRLRLQSAEK